MKKSEQSSTSHWLLQSTKMTQSSLKLRIGNRKKKEWFVSFFDEKEKQYCCYKGRKI